MIDRYFFEYFIYNEADNPDIPGADIDFLLRIIEGNTTIPVLLTDDAGNITGMAPSEEILPEPTPDPGPTDKERIAELEEALDLLLSGATGEETEVAANEA